MGNSSHKTAAWFFLFSKMTGAALRFYIPCLILQQFVLGKLGIPFAATAAIMVLLIWLYTRRSGIKALVWTDGLQTLCLITALLLIIYNVAGELGMDFSEAAEAVMSHPNSRVFVFDDWRSTQNFWKQFVSGIFIVVVMTGLDQDMMQKNLTCKSLRDAQKDMCAYGFAFLPVNMLFLALGILLMILTSQKGISLPDNGDQLLPLFAATGDMGTMVTVLFAIGIVAASFSSADSAITSMTTSYCVDIEEKETDEKLRKKTHLGICLVFALFVIMTNAINSKSIIDTVYVVCSYTYGPLLGMFAFSIFTKRKTNDRLVPLIAIGAPMACFAIDRLSVSYCGYKFGYELLMVNGLMVYLALLVTSRRHSGNRRLRRE
jgi:Na+/proline symporter